MKKRILIADDDASVRKSLGKVLEDEGYEITLTADGPEAIRRFESEPFDLLLLDIGLPAKNGWDTFEPITNRAPNFPIIIITGDGTTYDMAVAAGFGALMEKPLDVLQLLEMMKELLAESSEERLRRLCACQQDIRYSAPTGGRQVRTLNR